ncbi:MAG: thiol:disulfide interchange protein DsbA/DsbL [Pseudomonadales bacterium]
MAKKRRSAFLRRQKIALGTVAAVILGIVAWLAMIVIRDAPMGEFEPGEHYTVLEDPRRIRGDKIEIMEFFSYGCIHCYNFDPDLEDWVAEQGDTIDFVRTPAFASEQWRLLGRTYYAMQELDILEENHYRLFRSIHDGGMSLSSANQLARWIDGNGATAEEFRSAYNSPAVDTRVRSADQLGRRMKVSSVPTIIVNGKYRVGMTRTVGPSRMLEVMDHLVDKELQARESGAGGT